MARITKSQKAGLDFLDQIYFSDIVVHLGMNYEERQQLDTIIRSVKTMAERKYSGREAEVIKHLAYFLLEVNLATTTKELAISDSTRVLPPDLSIDTIEAVDNFKKDFQSALMFVTLEKNTGISAEFAFEIYDSLKSEFIGYSALVKRDLLTRCFVREFRDSSIGVYSWMTVKGVLPVTKNSPERLCNDFNENFETRLTLVADYEMLMHYFKLTISKDNSARVFLNNANFELQETTIDRLLDIQRVFHEAISKKSLRNSFPQLSNRDLNIKHQITYFFEQWGNRKTRLRTHTGTLASWPGIIGAGMVQKQLDHEYYEAAREKLGNCAGSVNISDLTVTAIYNAFDNQNTITESVREKLENCGIRISADTLYRSHTHMKKTLIRLLRAYCEMTRSSQIALSAMHDDSAYISIFIHSDNLPNQ